MNTNILITGAAGYIGGSIVADFIQNDIVKKEHIIATVRSDEQAKSLSKLGINVLQLDLTDEKAVTESVLRNNVTIVIQTVSSIDSKFSLPLITALKKQREHSGNETYFIHTSGLSAFYPKTGWPKDVQKDTGPIFDVEKQLADSFPIRKTDVDVIEYAKTQGVTSFIVVPSHVYGKGSGQWNQLSVVFPVYISTLISQKKVYKFPENTEISAVHITDLTALYGRIVEKILKKESLPNGTEGYYFALAHELHWWEVLEHVAQALKIRDLVTDTEIKTWPDDKFAAEKLGVPEKFVQALWNSGEKMTIERPQTIGWKPVWDKERFLQNINDEIDNVVELGKAKSSLIDSLHKAAA